MATVCVFFFLNHESSWLRVESAFSLVLLVYRGLLLDDKWIELPKNPMKSKKDLVAKKHITILIQSFFPKLFAAMCWKERGRRLQIQAPAHNAHHTGNDIRASQQIKAEAAFVILWFCPWQGRGLSPPLVTWPGKLNIQHLFQTKLKPCGSCLSRAKWFFARIIKRISGLFSSLECGGIFDPG